LKSDSETSSYNYSDSYEKDTKIDYSVSSDKEPPQSKRLKRSNYSVIRTEGGFIEKISEQEALDIALAMSLNDTSKDKV